MLRKIENMVSIKNKVAIITGTTKGLGQSLAEGLIEAGAKVIAIDRSDNDHLREYSLSYGSDFERIKADLLKVKKNDLRIIVDNIRNKYSKIDILINNAGISIRNDILKFGEKDWLDVLKMNLNVPFYLSQAVSKYFIEKGYGKIINIASMLSFQGGMNVPPYASSKHGIVGLTKSFANALAKDGINVNAIAPGFMKTDLTLPLQQDKKRYKKILERIPAGRWGNGNDLKGTLIFLASAMSDYVNGAIIPVDGGWLSGIM